MEILSIIYLSFMFLSLYMLFFILLLYLRNRKVMWIYPENKENHSVSVIIPAYNEEDSVEGTIKAVLESEYPLKEIIVVDDGSKDMTAEKVKKMISLYPNIKLLSKSNSGKADSLNKGISLAKGDLIAVVDSDSYPEKDAIRKMIGYFDDEKVGAVTSSILVRNKNNFFEKLQAKEYAVIAWTRKLLGFIDGVYATPGPLSIYRKEAIIKVGGFDRNNLTEDIEITWNLIKNGYKIEMCLPARVYSIAPSKVRQAFKQRIRWTIGGTQCLLKYKQEVLKKGKLAYFVIPYFSITTFLGVIGMGVFTYITLKSLLERYLFTKYTLVAGTGLLTMEDLNINVNVLNIFGITLFIMNLIFIITALVYLKDTKFKGLGNIFNLLFYTIIYLTAYPFILIWALGRMVKYKIIGKKIGWGTK